MVREGLLQDKPKTYTHTHTHTPVARGSFGMSFVSGLSGTRFSGLVTKGIATGSKKLQVLVAPGITTSRKLPYWSTPNTNVVGASVG